MTDHAHTPHCALRWSVGVVLVVVIAPFMVFGEQLEAAAAHAVAAPSSAPALGLLCIALLALDIALPIPSSVVATTSGAALGFWGGFICNWLGLTLGCFAGYLLGASVARRRDTRLRGPTSVERAANRYGVGAVVLLRAVPVLAEASVLHAGLSGVPLRRFAWAACLANAGVAAGYAAVGAYARSTSSFVWVVAGSALVPAVFMGLARLRRGEGPVAASDGDMAEQTPP
jgi:uncharacterized membrane protein YdjX (TVP38/TMEM64 family)